MVGSQPVFPTLKSVRRATRCQDNAKDKKDAEEKLVEKALWTGVPS